MSKSLQQGATVIEEGAFLVYDFRFLSTFYYLSPPSPNIACSIRLRLRRIQADVPHATAKVLRTLFPIS